MTLNKAIYIVKSFKWPKYRLRFISLIGFCFCLCCLFFSPSLFLAWLCATFHRLLNCCGVQMCEYVLYIVFYSAAGNQNKKRAQRLYIYKRTHTFTPVLALSCCHFRTILHSFNRIGSLPFSSLFVPFLSLSLFSRLHSILLCFKAVAEASHIIRGVNVWQCWVSILAYFAVWYRLRIYGQWARTQTTINNENKWVKQKPKQKRSKKNAKGKNVE